MKDIKAPQGIEDFPEVEEIDDVLGGWENRIKTGPNEGKLFFIFILTIALVTGTVVTALVLWLISIF